MENSMGKIGVVEKSSRKSKSLDVQSLYKKKRFLKDGGDKRKECPARNGVGIGEEEEEKKKKKKKKRKRTGRKEPEGKKSKRSFDVEEEYDANGFTSESVDSVRSVPSLSQKSNNTSNQFIGVSFSFDGNGNGFRIPKRPRGSVGRRRLGSNAASRLLSPLGSVEQLGKFNGELKEVGDAVDQVSTLPVSSGSQPGSSDWNSKLLSSFKVTNKTGLKDVKESINGNATVARYAKEEDGLSVVHNGDASSTKHRSNHRKRKGLVSESASVAEKVEQSMDKSGSAHDDFLDEDDEENLEENAARMLSSRFDPSCTGFPSNSISSLSPSVDQFSPVTSSGRDFLDHDVNSFASSVSPSVDISSRMLRPRKHNTDTSLSSKRCHYHEILPRDLNAYWVLNRRIKVFWPLDKRWYYGLVSGYDHDRKLHHIKYDDRDEEWVNLQHEKFKLLLLPSEVPDKGVLSESTGAQDVDKDRISAGTENGEHLRNCLDSEPIITWLNHSSRRVKHPTSRPVKKQKVIQLVTSTKSSLSFDRLNDSKGKLGPYREDRDDTSNALPDRLINGGMAEKSLSESLSSNSEVKKPLVVYFRKRFRKKGGELLSAAGKEIVGSSSSRTLTSLVPLMRRVQSKKDFGDTVKILWSFDDKGSLSLSWQLIRSEGYRFEICFPTLPWFVYIPGTEHLWLSHIMLLIQCGTIINRSPMVVFEMLFIDNSVGMRSLLFEGSLEKAVSLIFHVLSVFNEQAEQQKFVSLQLPVTSVRFRLSSIRGPMKQHVFAFHSFSKLKYSNWLYLDSELLHNCLLTRQLPLCECTYDNIKALEGRIHKLRTPYAGLKLPILEDLPKKSIQDVLPFRVPGESCKKMLPQSVLSFAIKPGKLPPFAVSFTAAPTFFLSLHLQMLMNQTIACFNLRDIETVSSLRDSEIISQQIVQHCSEVQSYSGKGMGIVPVHDVESSAADANAFACYTVVPPLLRDEVIPVSDAGDNVTSPWVVGNGKVDAAENSACSRDLEKTKSKPLLAPHICDTDDQQLKQQFASSQLSLSQMMSSPTLSSAISYSGLDGRSIDLSSSDQVDGLSSNWRAHLSGHASDLTWDTAKVHTPNSPAPKSSWRLDRSNRISSPLGDVSLSLSNGKTDIVHGVFSNGPKKRRTQVQYTLPFGGYDLSSKHRNQRSLPYKRIRRADDKKTTEGSRSFRRNLELSSCNANVLVTLGDRGWREMGARVVLELGAHNEWRLLVKLSDVTKYSYKVNNVLQPGSTNRYTHAMMWKGGKDWVLEFPDRSQWALFKEMHEECYNRNIRAASVKNIPIPGVRPIEEIDDCATDVRLFRHSAKYFRQVENDVEMALNPSHVLYDMDSDDERWLLEQNRSLSIDNGNCEEITDELFEKTMDMFEKVAYAQQRDQFTSDEINELMVEVGSAEVVKVIYEHWQCKRQQRSMPLIRHLQPPSWQIYLQQVKEWEQGVSRANNIYECKERALANEKPPMFAFCLKPRGLEIPNKGSKHRSQKKIPALVQNHSVSGDQDGRRSNGNAVCDEKVVFSGNGHNASEASLLLQASTRSFPPHDACGLGYFSLTNDALEWNQNVKHKNTVKKTGGFPCPSNASFNQSAIGKRNGVHHWSVDVPGFPSQKQYHHYDSKYRHNMSNLDVSDLQEFRLRDASGAAQHALNIAKLKRGRAQRLLYRADLAIHKAVVALMTAEAIKAASTSTEGGEG